MPVVFKRKFVSESQTKTANKKNWLLVHEWHLKKKKKKKSGEDLTFRRKAA